MLEFRAKIFKGLSGSFYISDIISSNKEAILKADLFYCFGDSLDDFFDENEIEKLKHPTAIEMDATIEWDAEKYDAEGSPSDWVSITILNVHFYEFADIASIPDTFDTKKGEYPKETGIYLCKIHHWSDDLVPFYGYYRSELKAFFGNDSDKPIEVLWQNIPTFRKV